LGGTKGAIGKAIFLKSVNLDDAMASILEFLSGYPSFGNLFVMDI